MTDAPQGPNFSDQAQAAPGQDAGADDLLEKFARWDKALLAHWSTWQEKAQYWYAFASGEQWTTEEIASLEENSKIPVTFNMTAPVIDAVSGAEISNRQQVQFYPREAGDTGIGDALTQGADWINDECNGDQEDSEAFWDTLVCGMGWTQTRPEVEGDEVKIVKERIDPLQMRVDPSARKRCVEDARYLKREIPMSPDEFEEWKAEVGREDLTGLEGEGLGVGKRLTVVDPQQRYSNGRLGEGQGDDTIIVCEWQWWERRPVVVASVPDPQNPGQVKAQTVDPQTFAQLQAADPSIRHTQSTKRVYYRAFATAHEVLFQEEMPEETFRYKCITGKRDRNTGTWFGLVKPMVDPGKFVNKLYSEVLHIIRTNANGGMALEEDAVSDVRQFEDTWSSTDKITWLKSGALSGAHGAKMLPKTPPLVQPALFQMMEFARDMVQKTTGVNEEMLGLVQRDQAGVLEAQRKQAAYGILSAFFDAKRRYQREQGRLLLAMIRLYLPDDKLVRIVDQGTAQFVAIAKTADACKYDVVVDEAPASPDQKAKVWAILQPLLPQLIQGNLISPETLADVVQYLDLPAAVSAKLAAAIRGQAQASSQPDPAQVANVALTQAKTREHEAGAQVKQAKAFKEVTDAHATHIGLGADFLRSTTRPDQTVAPPGGPQPPGAAGPPSQGPQPGPAPAPGSQPGVNG